MRQKDIWDNLYSSSPHVAISTEWIKKFDNYFCEMKNYTIIDLGCGRGDNAHYLKESGYNVIACDFSQEAISYINNTHPTIETRCFDMINEFPHDFKNIGVVFASLSTHYFSLKDTIKLYDNICDMLEPNGYFIFRVNSKEELEKKNKSSVESIIEDDYYLLNDGNTKRFFDIESMSKLLNRFTIVDIQESKFEYRGQMKYYVEGICSKTKLPASP